MTFSDKLKAISQNALLASVLTAGLTQLGNSYIGPKLTHDYKVADDERDARAKERAEERSILQKRQSDFLLTAADFNTFASGFAHGLIEDKHPDDKSKRELHDNLLKQTDIVMDLVNKGVVSKLDALRYSEALSAMSKAVDGAQDVLHMRPFWDRASDLLTIRDEIAGKFKITG